MTANKSNKTSDDDFDFAYVAIAIVVFSVLVAKLVLIPYFYLLALIFTPIFAGGFFGGLLIVALSTIPIIMIYKSHNNGSDNDSLAPFFKKASPYLVFTFLYLIASLIFRHHATSFIMTVCPVPDGDNKFLWVKHCPPVKAFFSLGFVQASTMFLLPNFILLTPLLAKLVQLAPIAFNPPLEQYKRPLDVEQYISLQKTIYSHLLFFEKVNPLDFPVYKGQYRLLDNAKRFVFSKKLVDGFTQKPLDNGISEIINDSLDTRPELDDHNYTPTINAFLFKEQMLLQMGELYTTLDELPPLQMILLSVFVPRLLALDPKMGDQEAEQTLNQYYADIDELWQQVARKVTKQKNAPPIIDTQLNPTYLEKRKQILKEKAQHPLFIEITDNHAYVNTILIETVLQVRKLGVAQASEFGWLLYFDRNLFALMNNISRPAYFCESLAPNTHHEFEKAYKGKLYNIDCEVMQKCLENELITYYYPPKLVQDWQEFLKTHDPDSVKNFDVYAYSNDSLELQYTNEQNLQLHHKQTIGHLDPIAL